MSILTGTVANFTLNGEKPEQRAFDLAYLTCREGIEFDRQREQGKAALDRAALELDPDKKAELKIASDDWFNRALTLIVKTSRILGIESPVDKEIGRLTSFEKREMIERVGAAIVLGEMEKKGLRSPSPSSGVSSAPDATAAAQLSNPAPAAEAASPK